MGTRHKMSTPNKDDRNLNMAMSLSNPEELRMKNVNHGNLAESSLNGSSDSAFDRGDFDRSFNLQPIAFSTPIRPNPESELSKFRATTTTPDIEGMNNFQLKMAILALVEEKEALQKEVEVKQKIISQVQSQMKSLLEQDINRSLPSPIHTPSGRHQMSSSIFQTEIQKSFETSRGQRRLKDRDSFYLEPLNESSIILEELEDPEINATQNTPSPRRSGMIPETTLIFIREMTNFINFSDVSLNRERVYEAAYLSGQISLGATAGWASAYFLKNFGKAALTAVGGGGLIIGYAQYKGYIHINWNEICEQLDHINTSSISNDSNLSSSSSSSSSSWTTEQLRMGREWINNHSVTAGSFLVSFLYNLI